MFLCKFNNTNPESKTKVATKIKDLIWNKGLTNTGRFLFARMLYADGLVIVTTGVGIFGTSVIGLSLKEILLAAILANISGAIGCYLYGIFFKEKHIGNIELNEIDNQKLTANITYIIGEREYWGKGIASYCINFTIMR